MSFDPLLSRVTPHTPRPHSYWLSTAALPEHAPLKKDCRTDFLVIGGGYTGLSAALTLAEADQNVMLIDAHDVGFGCAGRNAGFVLTGTGRLGADAIAKKWNATVAEGMQREFEQAVTLLNARISQYGIDCDAMHGPYIKIAHSRKHAARLEASVQGTSNTFVSATALNDILRIQGSYGAVIQDGQTVNPLKLAAGLARAAVSRGATLYGGTPALNLQRHTDHVVVTTPHGSINAKHVLIATNAYTPPTFDKAVDSRQFPVQSSILVTSPLTEAQQQETGLNRPMSMMDTRMMKYYYRTLPDGRLLFGGRGAVTGKHASASSEKQRLMRAMLNSFPALNGISMDYFWSGWVSVSLDSLPRIYTEPDAPVGYAMGYCGSGVSFAGLAGTRLAQRMLQGQSAEQCDHTLPLYSSPLPRYPLAGLRRLGLRALYTWAKFAE
ncbi:NAD(P)/FAD-dependent oxidoreductase [Alteromonas sp. CYL-A6]|uniref:NAD(P)/FAD-dependent oxidoreductase n=1 Tax=Alteromonas nitratireducens TaxID=3390813 RepID=UPI0034B7EDE3